MTMRTAIKDFLMGFPYLDGQFRRLVWSRVHFPESELRFLDALPAGSIDIAVDVGAALGSYTWILSRKSKQVYAFEPGARHGAYLANLVPGTNVSLVRLAVGAGAGKVQMYTPGEDDNAYHSATLSTKNPIVQTAGTVTTEVEQISLDDYFAGKLGEDRSIDFLKVDIEGYEFEAFKGALGLIKRHRPLIVSEIEKRHDANCRRTFELLRSQGYDAYYHRNGAYIPFDGTDVSPFQTEEALRYRLGPGYNPSKNAYINNFVFQHPQSRIKVS